MKSEIEDNPIGFLAHDVARLLGRRFNQRAKSLGLNRNQCRALAYIWRGEGMIQAALADLLDIEPISLVRLLDRMAEAGWVERRADQADRRTRRLFLTEKAHTLIVEIRAISAEVSAEAFSGLNDEERKQLLGLLQHVRHTLQGLEGCGDQATVSAGPAGRAPRQPPPEDQTKEIAR